MRHEIGYNKSSSNPLQHFYASPEATGKLMEHGLEAGMSRPEMDRIAQKTERIGDIRRVVTQDQVIIGIPGKPYKARAKAKFETREALVCLGFSEDESAELVKVFKKNAYQIASEAKMAMPSGDRLEEQQKIRSAIMYLNSEQGMNIPVDEATEALYHSGVTANGFYAMVKKAFIGTSPDAQVNVNGQKIDIEAEKEVLFADLDDSSYQGVEHQVVGTGLERRGENINPHEESNPDESGFEFGRPEVKLHAMIEDALKERDIRAAEIGLVEEHNFYVPPSV